jgi:hypothetical protein
MRKAETFLQKWGIHSFLLPVFFVLHNYNQYYGLVSFPVVIKVLAQILIGSLFFFVFLFLIIRNINKCLQITSLTQAVMLFFGVVQDLFRFNFRLQFLSRYFVLLPLIFIAVIILIGLVLKKKDFKKSNLYQNIVLIVFIVFEIGMLFDLNRVVFLPNNLLAKNISIRIDSLPTSELRPDVYYLVFDSYPGTKFLQDYMDYDNTSFNDSLRKEGFFVVNNPKSNYNRTIFSIASTLNFEYLKGINENTSISPKSYNLAKLTIENAIVPKIFKHYNYTIYNLSIFDIGKSESMRKETFLVLPEKNVLLYNTLPERLRADLLWHLLEGENAIPAMQKLFARNEEEFANQERQKRMYNNMVIDSLLKIPLQKTGNPKFIYAHVYLPHPPFFYDENGKENDFNYVLTEESQKNSPLFLSYLRYTNKTILKIINSIILNSDSNAVIILQSDHGYRDFEGALNFPETFFKNYSAFYFPDKNYSTIYDTISNINNFPVLFNKYFNTKIPMQPDTVISLPY